MKLAIQEKRAQIKVDKFNSLYPIGTKMNLKDDAGKLHPIILLAPASVMSCCAVGWASEGFGCYSLDRFKPIKQKKCLTIL